MPKSLIPTVTSASRPDLGGNLDLLSQLSRAPSRVAGVMLLWHTRAVERSHLAKLEDYHLQDMGISRAEADREAAKPFWKA